MKPDWGELLNTMQLKQSNVLHNASFHDRNFSKKIFKTSFPNLTKREKSKFEKKPDNSAPQMIVPE